MTYCVRSFEPIEKKAASNDSTVSAAAGTSTMMPSCRATAGDPGSLQGAEGLIEIAARAVEFARKGDHRQHHFDAAMRRRPTQRPKLRAKGIGLVEREADAAQPEERIGFVLERQSCDRLVRAGVEGADGDRFARRPLGEPSIGAILGFFVREPSAPAGKEEFSANEPDPVAIRRIEPFDFRRIGDVHDKP